MDELLIILHSTFRMTAPIALAAIGGVFAHRAGVLNVALEGMMLVGAFTGVMVSYLTGSILIAVLAAVLSSMILGLLFSVFGITLKGNVIITGLAINTIVLGLTAYILQVFFGQRGVFSNPKIIGLEPLDIPILRDIPILSDILNNQTPMVYVSLLALILAHFVLYHTKLGLYIRTVGEKEEAAYSVGLPVNKLKYISVLIGSFLCGLGGVNIALENVTMFVEDMTVGRGFIALAAIFSGQGTPIGTFIFSFLFGFADALQIRLQSLNIPGAFIQMIPFLFIVLVLTVVGIISVRGRTSRGIKNE
ncbi:ABC transporter permease [Peribacillus loiseleuriae]|uniref:Sugar ABC transporter permease n=1 Tax=Peribacillus loiseleuriae TaxID=1679170 RepID=A0A0K9GY04_9BACI|nr:ABC transporter permease [Peribacillus loiseleuriae]KMY51500.1 hypothetical protein AC625_19755 [Peribacillus loiseleuriae]